VNTSISGGWACSSGTVLTEDSNKLKVVAGNGSNDIQLTNPSNIEALGPASLDLTDDGITDVPYVTTNGKIKITNETNQTTTIADSSPDGINAMCTTGAWKVRDSDLAGNTGSAIDATGAAVEGNVTYDYWGTSDL